MAPNLKDQRGPEPTARRIRIPGMARTLRGPSNWRRWSLALLAASALLVFGLSRAEPGAAHSAVRRSHVKIEGFAYHPGTLRIRRGTSVVFANRSSVAHTATRRGAFDTGAIAPGSSVVVRFNKRGTFLFHCKIHPFMKGTIVVH